MYLNLVRDHYFKRNQYSDFQVISTLTYIIMVRKREMYKFGMFSESIINICETKRCISSQSIQIKYVLKNHTNHI